MHAQVNGTQMAYTDEGAGRTLLLVHGFPLNRQVWSPQVAAFRRDFRVIAPDLRGLGESWGTADPVAMDRYAEDLQALMTHLNAGPVILAGHSMGGYVALAFAKAFPQSLAGLVLVGTKAGADTPEAAAARRASAERVRAEGSAGVVEAMAARMLSPGNTDAGMVAEVRGFMTSSGPDGIIAALLGMAERPDAGAWLGQIQAPTLVLAGADDAIMPPAEAEALARAIPRAQLKVLPKAGHLLAYEQAEAFNEALRTWLRARL
jgi:pimeloyl-ACP methyl ester carboxylesterase